MTAGSRRFVFGPLERRGLLLGLAPSQLLSLVGGLLFALILVHARPDAFGVLGGLVVTAGGVAGACLPLAGRPPASWVPVAVAWLARRWEGPVRSGAPLVGDRCGPSADPEAPSVDATHGRGAIARAERVVTRTCPARRSRVSGGSGCLAPGVEVLAATALPGEPALGVVRDRPAGTWGAVLPVRGGAFALLDPADKERRLATWGSLLAGLARPGSPVQRVQWDSPRRSLGGTAFPL